MSPVDSVLPCIRAIAPYQPGQPASELARLLDVPEANIVKLASNENPLGMSPAARDALHTTEIHNANRYPDQHELTSVLARHLELPSTYIILGNGSNDVLELAARIFLSAGRSALMSRHAFAVYALATRASGAQLLVADPGEDFGHDLNAMRALLRDDTRVVWIANPNNPTGTWLSSDSLREFIRSIPAGVAVVLDEAYNEYLPPGCQDTRLPDTVHWPSEFPNLIVTRTFSKIHGLAGLRVGYAVSNPEIIDLMHRVRQPFNVNRLALAAATAALGDSNFIRNSQVMNAAGRAQLIAGLQQLQLSYLPAYGNFVCFHTGRDTPDAGAQLFNRLQQAGVIVRMLSNYEMPAWLRVSVGTPEENDRFLSVLPAALGTSL